MPKSDACIRQLYCRHDGRSWLVWLVLGASLLVAVPVTFCLVGICGGRNFDLDDRRMEEAVRQREAVAALKEMGCGVAYDYMDAYAATCDQTKFGVDHADPPGVPEDQLKALGRDYFAYVDAIFVTNPKSLQYAKDLPRLREVRLAGPKIADDVLSTLSDVAHLEQVVLADAEVTDAGLAHVGVLKELRSLEVRGTRISDAGMVHLTKMPALEFLYLKNTNIGDGGLKHVARIRKLRSLAIANSPITDNAIANLKGLSELKWLDLDDTNITDAGLEHVYSLQGLWSLSLRRTGVTSKGIDKLRRAIPNCRVFWEGK
jgi:hypothetical protein